MPELTGETFPVVMRSKLSRQIIQFVNSMHVVDGFLSENLKNKERVLHFQNVLRSSRPKVVSHEVMSLEMLSNQ